MIDTILDACRDVLEINGDPQSPYWLSRKQHGFTPFRIEDQSLVPTDKSVDVIKRRVDVPMSW